MQAAIPIILIIGGICAPSYPHGVKGIYFEAAMTMKPGTSSRPLGAAAANHPSLMQDQLGSGMRMTARGWRSGDMCRIEFKNRDSVRTSITNRSGSYQLQPTMKTAIRSDVASAASKRGVASISLLDPSGAFDPKVQLKDAEQVGVESICGVDCVIWRGDPPSVIGISAMASGGNQRMKVWIAKNGRPSFPMKVEVLGAGPNGATVAAWVTKLSFVDNIPQSFFVVPKDYRIRQAPTAFRKPTPGMSTKGEPTATSSQR